MQQMCVLQKMRHLLWCMLFLCFANFLCFSQNLLTQDELFTQEEKAFINECNQNKTVFSALITAFHPPYVYFENGMLKGTCVDIIKECNNLLGLSVNFIQTDTQEGREQALLHSAADLCFDMTYSSQKAQSLGYNLSAPYLQESLSLLCTRKNANATTQENVTTKKMYGIVRYFGIEECVKQNAFLQNMTFITYNSVDDAIKSLLNNEIAGIFLYTQNAEYIAKRAINYNLYCTSVPFTSIDICVGIKQSQNPLLESVINKAISTISQAKKTSIIMQYQDEILPEENLLYARPLVFIIALLLCFAILLYVGIFLARRKIIENTQNFKNELEKSKNKELDFLQQLSYDLQKPSNELASLIELAKEEFANSVSLKTYFSKIKSKNEELSTIINDIFYVTKINRGKLINKETLFSVKKLLISCVSSVDNKLSVHDFDFRCDFSRIESEYFYGSERYLHDALNNLLRYIIDNSEDGARIDFVAEELSTVQKQKRIRITLSNSSLAVNASSLDENAKKHTREWASLSVVKMLIKNICGIFQIDTDVSKKTVFVIEVPLLIADAFVDTTPAQILKNAQKNATILLATEQDLNKKIMQRVFAKHNIALEIVDGACNALNAYLKEKDSFYSMIIFDACKNASFAISAMQKIRQSAKLDAENTPLVCILPHDSESDIEKIFANGATDYLLEPILEGELLSLCIKYL